MLLVGTSECPFGFAAGTELVDGLEVGGVLELVAGSEVATGV